MVTPSVVFPLCMCSIWWGVKGNSPANHSWPRPGDTLHPLVMLPSGGRGGGRSARAGRWNFRWPHWEVQRHSQPDPAGRCPPRQAVDAVDQRAKYGSVSWAEGASAFRLKSPRLILITQPRSPVWVRSQVPAHTLSNVNEQDPLPLQ